MASNLKDFYSRMWARKQSEAMDERILALAELKGYSFDQLIIDELSSPFGHEKRYIYNLRDIV